jgi:hypothetical protein
MSQPKQTQREHPNEIARRYGLNHQLTPPNQR